MGNSFLADIPNNQFVAVLGTTAAVASNGADGRVASIGFVCPAPLRLLSAWRANLAANEVTVGTATSSASYRRHLIYNGGSAGTGTATASIMASQNATASGASLGARSFVVDTTVTAAAGDILYYSHLTVGAATANGTDAAAGTLQIAYQLL